MGALTNFAFEEHLVRVVDRDGEPWFAGKDVCGALGIRDHHQALEKLDADERGGYDVPTPQGLQRMIVVSEAGVFRLVFRSSKPEAERFKRWLAHEVLPAIRRTGRYGPETPAAEPESLALARMRIDMVREARIMFGPARAALLWAELGLPPVPEIAPDREPEECLAWLLARPVAGATAGTLLARALAGDAGAEAALAPAGIRIERDAGRAGFLIASSKPQARALFSGSRWHSGRWVKVLRRLDGAAGVGTLSFDRWASRATFIPAEWLEAG